MLQEAPSPAALFDALCAPHEQRRSFVPLTPTHATVVQALADAALLIPKIQQVGLPSAGEQRQIFERDGWHCRCRGVPVVSPQACAHLSARHNSLRWGKRNAERHAGIFALMASLDHVLPRSRGGRNEPSNLLTACWPCQFGRMDWTYDEVQMANPRTSPAHPRLAGWDGLTQCR